MRRALIVLGVVTLSIAATLAAAPKPLVAKRLEPTSKWSLDYGEERCSLAQLYGNGDQKVLLQVDSFGSRSNFRVTLAGKGVPPSFLPAGVGAIRLPGDPNVRGVTLQQGTVGPSGEPAVFFMMSFMPYEAYDHLRLLSAKQIRQEIEPEKVFTDFERTIDSITLAFNSDSAVELRVGSMAAPLVALRACVDELDKSWDLDPDVQKSLSRPAHVDEADIGRLQHDFRKRMDTEGPHSIVPARLMIDAGGTVTSCVMQVPTVNPVLKADICRNLMHFEPALDATGKPVASAYLSSVTFLLGDVWYFVPKGQPAR